MDIKDLYTVPSSMFPLMPDKDTQLIPEILKFYKAQDVTELHSLTKHTIAEFMTNVNSYYSNLIEGNKTNPLDIEKALKGEIIDEKKRLKVMENTAHIKTEKIIKKRIAEEPDLNIVSQEFICFIHKTFYENMPEEALNINHNGREYKIVPGQLRTEEIKVGRHIPPYSKSLPDFLSTFEKFYNLDKKNDIQKIITFAASHQRLVWIHPFLDGNGRVARLFSTAMACKLGIDEHGLWSISRGLAKYNKTYYAELENADSPRMGDLDGRGNLSEKMLVNFCKFFINTATDQIQFIKKVFEFENFEKNMESLALSVSDKKPALAADYKLILTAVARRGEVPRGEIAEILRKPDRTAREILKKLIDKELLTSLTPRSGLRLNLPTQYAVLLFPKLFPQSEETEILAAAEKNEVPETIEEDSVKKKVEEAFSNLESIYTDKKTEILELRELCNYLEENEQLELIEELSEKEGAPYDDIYDTVCEKLRSTLPNNDFRDERT